LRVLLTGASGFVGSQMLEDLVGLGDDVRVLALPDTVEKIRHKDRVQIVQGSLADSNALTEATRDREVVYHLAAIHLSALRAAADPRNLRSVNVEGTGNLLQASVASGVRRIVFSSSVAVYNPAPWSFMWPIHETHTLRTMGQDSLRSYAQSKIEAEHLITRCHQEHGIEAVVLRSSAVYGGGAPWVERMVRSLAGNPWAALTQAGRYAGNQWIHRRDLARAMVMAGTGTALQHELCNVAGGELFSARDILVTISGLLGGPLAGMSQPSRSGGNFGLRYDLTRSQSRLGFAPRVKLREGLEEVLAAMDPKPHIARLAPASAAGDRWQLSEMEFY
jgi:UDP-glucose 4-epimerase